MLGLMRSMCAMVWRVISVIETSRARMDSRMAESDEVWNATEQRVGGLGGKGQGESGIAWGGMLDMRRGNGLGIWRPA